MRFPLIKVKRGDAVRIVGSNSHDFLCIDEETGGLQYTDLQSLAGTEKHNGSACLNFVPNEQDEIDAFMGPTVEMVSLEELIEIATQNLVDMTENQIKMFKIAEAHVGKEALLEENQRAGKNRKQGAQELLDEKVNNLNEMIGKYTATLRSCHEKLKDYENIYHSDGDLIL